MKAVRPLLLGVSGLTLTPDERAFLAEAPPMGFLLFARNIESADQVRKLTDELAEFAPFGAPLIAVDQEGGRVQRVKFGGQLPPVRAFGEWYRVDAAQALEAARLSGFLLAAQLRDVGANWLLGPLLDVANEATHAIIGDRAFADNPTDVIALATAYANGVAEGGCLRCLKHAPGHGRAVADSHLELPIVGASVEELQTDFMPFKAMAPREDFLMTAHIRYTALDAMQPATYSPAILNMMRDDWGFGGLILADDVGMKALEGSYPERIVRSLEAGCDVAIAALSVLKHGMAGTFFDEENFAALVRADIPTLGEDSFDFLNTLVVPDMPHANAVHEARARLMELWADAPVRMRYSLSL